MWTATVATFSINEIMLFESRFSASPGVYVSLEKAWLSQIQTAFVNVLVTLLALHHFTKHWWQLWLEDSFWWFRKDCQHLADLGKLFVGIMFHRVDDFKQHSSHFKSRSGPSPLLMNHGLFPSLGFGFILFKQSLQKTDSWNGLLRAVFLIVVECYVAHQEGRGSLEMTG